MESAQLTTWLGLVAGHFTSGVLIFGRFAGLLFAGPVISSRTVPVPVRMGLGVTLTLVVAPLFRPVAVESGPLFAALMIKEILVGLVMGWLASLVFATAQMAGEWMDLQGGFQAAHTMNPAFSVNSAPMGNIKMLIAGLVFLGAGGHTAIIAACAASFAVSPPGTLAIHLAGSGDWVAVLVRAMWLAIQLAEPVGVALFLAEVAAGIASRALPQVNMMILTLPVKAVVAVCALAMALPLMARGLAGIFSAIPSDLAHLLGMVRS